MGNEILVKLYVPNIEKSYDVWIPIQRRVGNVIVLLLKAINEMNFNIYRPTMFPMLHDRETAKMYDVSDLIKDTDIRNGSELIII